MKIIAGLLLIPLLCSCASIVKNQRQTVVLNGGLGDGSTKVSTPEGVFTLTEGQTTIMLTRTRADVPIEVTCNGKTQRGVLPTNFDVMWAGLGNVVFGGVPGWIIDGVGDKGYDIKSPYNVGPLCAQDPRVPAAQH